MNSCKSLLLKIFVVGLAICAQQMEAMVGNAMKACVRSKTQLQTFINQQHVIKRIKKDLLKSKKEMALDAGAGAAGGAVSITVGSCFVGGALILPYEGLGIKRNAILDGTLITGFLSSFSAGGPVGLAAYCALAGGVIAHNDWWCYCVSKK